MKNWKRFMAACLSVTMLATTPLTTLADNMSTTPVAVSNEKAEPQKTEEFEAILSHKTPYQYFTGLKNQQEIVDGLSNEQLFQLKELMKYAYIHENSKENRQSLEPYLLIIKKWNENAVSYSTEEKKSLLEKVFKKLQVYKSTYDDKEVTDLTSYVKYLEDKKGINVIKYSEVLTGLEQAKTDEGLEKAKSSLKAFEDNVFGFKEHSDESENPEEAAVESMLEDGQYIKVYYLLYDGDIENVFSNFIVHSPYEILEDGTLRAVINAHPDRFDYSNNGKMPIDIDINRGMHNGRQIPITEECTYNETQGYVDIPAEHAAKDLTVTVWQSRDSEFYALLPDEYKPQEDIRDIEMYGIFNDIFPSGTIPPNFSAKGCNVIDLNANINSVNVGDSWSATGSTWYIANRYNEDSWIWSDVAGADAYNPYFSQGQIINIESCDNPIFVNAGSAGPDSKNWLFTGCLSEVSNKFAGVPLITQLDIECIKKEGTTATFFIRAKCKGPNSKPAQTVGGFFKANMKNTYTLTYDGNGGLYGENSSWSETVTYGSDCLIWDNFFDIKGYTFAGWNTDPYGNGEDWTPWIGKTWNWSYSYDVTLYAQWKPKSYTVTYDGNGGTWGENTQWSESIAFGNNYTTYDNFFDRYGYTFKGWNTDPYGNGEDWTPWIGKQWRWSYDYNLTLYAQWERTTFGNTVSHWLWGFKNGEGNNAAKTAYRINDDVPFYVAYNDSFVLDSNKTVTAPNGTHAVHFSSPDLNTEGNWIDYPLGTQITQPNHYLGFQCGYFLYDYNISYQLNGGKNHIDNPKTYNVLYGQTLQKPTKEGYVFKGWEENLFVDTRVKYHFGASRTGTTHSFASTVTGNVFDSSKIQLWDKDYQSFLVEIANGKNEQVDVEYTHNYESGIYTLRIGANGSASDTCSFLKNVYFEKGKTYRINYNSTVTNSKVTMGSIKVMDTNVTGINEGKNGSFSSASVLYSELAQRKTENVILSAKWEPITYTVKFDGNDETGGTTADLIYGYNESKPLNPNGFHKDGFVFEGWNTSPNGDGTPYKDKEIVKNLSLVDKSVVILYAQWKPITYNIHYKGNGSLSGMDKVDKCTQKELTANKGYIVKENQGYTDFVFAQNKFKGWFSSSVVDSKELMSQIYTPGVKLTPETLLKIHEEQLKNNIVTDKGITEKDIVLYAVWDKAPEITFSDSFKDQFYEGTTVTREDLLNGVTAQDDIDADIANKVVITQIEYAAGKLSETGKEDAYTQKWKDGMPEDAVLDTWFMKLDKNDAPVKHKVTYQVTDSAGNVTTVTKEVKVLYNEFPEIVANDQRFSLEDAQDGVITEDALLKDLIESGQLSASDTEEGDLSSRLELVDFDPTLFTTMKREGFIPITYRVRDTMGPDGNGKETLKRVNVNIFAVRPGKRIRYARFINKEYYYKNANLDLNSMTKQEIALKAVNGGLHPKSLWYTDPEYREFITKALDNNTPRESYQYTKEDIQKMREFVKEHGIGNAKEEDALDKFAEIFMTGHYKIK